MTKDRRRRPGLRAGVHVARASTRKERRVVAIRAHDETKSEKSFKPL
jgi:hypothetical protein